MTDQKDEKESDRRQNDRRVASDADYSGPERRKGNRRMGEYEATRAHKAEPPPAAPTLFINQPATD